ncbi:MAG TPA: TonB-dependent receptor [Gemmatimonadales bacterium]
MTNERPTRRARRAVAVLSVAATASIVAPAIAADAAAQARPDTARDSARARRLDTVTVTVTRSPARAAALPQQVQVVTAADIARTPSADLADALKKNAAVDVIQFPGLLSGIGIRGFRPEYSGLVRRTLMLVDGRPSGVSNLATVDLAGIERIEVLKGPASSLYGSSAMGGAVNVVTRRSRGPVDGTVTASYGSWRTADVSLAAGGALGSRVDFDVSGRLFSRGENYRIGSGNALRDMVGGGAVRRFPGDSLVDDLGDGVTRESSRHHSQGGSARLGVELGGGVRADLRGELFEANGVEVPGDIFFGTDQDGRKNLYRNTAELALAAERGRHRPMLRAYTALEGFDYYATWADEPFVSSVNETTTRGVQLQDAVRLGAHTLTAGVDVGQVRGESRSWSDADTRSAPYSPDASVGTVAGFAEARWQAPGGRLSGTVGARLDRVTLDVRETPFRADLVAEEETFTSVSPSAGVQYLAAGWLRVHASAGRAFVAPDPFNKAGLARTGSAAGGINVTTGNHELDAESSVTVDVGLGMVRPSYDLDVTYFRTDVSDRITTVAAFFPEGSRPRTAAGDEVARVTTYANAGDARMHGLEAAGSVDVGALLGRAHQVRLFANATRIFSAEQRVRAASVDAGRFAGRTDFRYEEAVGAVTFGEERSERIRNVATLSANFGLELDDLRRFSGRVSGRYVGRRLDSDFTDWMNPADVEYPPFMTLDLTAGVRLTDRARVDVMVTNLTDENYYEVRGYPLPGRSVAIRTSVGLR